MFSSIGTSELLIIVLVILLLFGSKQLPELVRSLAKGWRDIQKTTQEVKDEIQSVIDDESELLG
jgi:sec-independent protein translocase protein TatA